MTWVGKAPVKFSHSHIVYLDKNLGFTSGLCIGLFVCESSDFLESRPCGQCRLRLYNVTGAVLRFSFNSRQYVKLFPEGRTYTFKAAICGNQTFLSDPGTLRLMRTTLRLHQTSPGLSHFSTNIHMYHQSNVERC